MIKDKLNFLRAAVIAYICIAAVLWCFSFHAIFFPEKTFANNLERASHVADTVYYLAVWLLAVIIVLRARRNTGNLLFAFLMTCNSIVPTISVAFEGIALNVVAVINNVLFYVLLLKTFQFFPKPITPDDIRQTFRRKFIRWFLLGMHSRKVWFILPWLAMISMLSYAFNTVLFLTVLFTVAAYLYINLRKSVSDRNKVLWLFWGLDLYIIMFILLELFSVFNNQDTTVIEPILSIISVMALLLALSMSFFFFDTFDTGVIVKRTIINSFILICIVFVYNVAEHYLLHWVSHKLHLSDALVASVFSGFLVVSFSPLHHKLMHFFEKRLKSGDPHKSQ